MIVADASVVLELVLRTALSAQCDALLLEAGAMMCAPQLINLEVVQVLRRYERGATLSLGRSSEAFQDFLDLPIVLYPHEPLITRVWQLRHTVTAYDGAYIALAEALNAPLMTCDAHLARSHGHEAVVRLVG